MRRAFTLVEMLVVVAVIGLLVAILAPTLSRARGSAKLTACASNLRQVGVAVRAYLGASSDRLPFASFMPSIGPAPLDGPEPVYIAEVLAIDAGKQTDIFKCPNDRTDNQRPAPNYGKSYFTTERSSYEYQVRLGGLTLEQFARDVFEHTQRVIPINSIWIFRDFNNFNAAAGASGSRRYLYGDGRVTDFEM